jgi:hypothetical protein
MNNNKLFLEEFIQTLYFLLHIPFFIENESKRIKKRIFPDNFDLVIQTFSAAEISFEIKSFDLLKNFQL